MFYKIQNWIDKELGAISKDPLFVYYFEGANLNEIEDSFYLCNKAAGIEMVLSNDLTISSIHLFSGKKGDFEVYKGELPFGLTFCLSQREIQTCLGKPKKWQCMPTSMIHPAHLLPAWVKNYIQMKMAVLVPKDKTGMQDFARHLSPTIQQMELITTSCC